MPHYNRYRCWLKQRLSGVQVPILGGPLRGAWFGLFTGTRFLRGTYGRNESRMFERLLQAGDVVYDVGAHVGYFTLLASQLVRSGGRVFAFEPLPLNVAYLERHKRMNRLANVEVLPFAVGRAEGHASFGSTGGTGRGRLASADVAAERLVRVVSLDEMYSRGQLPAPTLIKMDIEGVEGDALRGATRLLAEHRPKILLSVHGQAAKRDCETQLAALGYELSYFKDSTIVALPAAA